MNCNKCRHNDEIARLREICSRCKMGDSAQMSDATSLDALAHGREDPIVTKNEIPVGEASQPVTTLPESAENAFRILLADLAVVDYDRIHDLITLVRTFEGLDRGEFALVQHFLNGGTMASYARAQNPPISKQTAFARCKALFRHKPVFAGIANGMLGKLKGGRKRGHARQLELNFG